MIALKKKITAMEELVAKTPATTATQANGELFDLSRRRLETEKNLELNNRKLEDARLGEKLERDQRSERLQVIEQPIFPTHPIKPNRTKFLALAFALSVAAGAGAIFLAESLASGIRYSHELNGVANGRGIVSIPYIATRAETARRKSRLAISASVIGALLVTALIVALFFGPPIELSWVNQYWLDHLTRLSK